MDSSFDDSKFFRAPKDLKEMIVLFVFLGGLVWLAVTWEALSSGKYEDLKTNQFLFWSLFLALLFAYLVTSIRYFPPCSFDTKRRARMDEQKSWAKKTVWSLVTMNLIAIPFGGAIVDRVTALIKSP